MKNSLIAILTASMHLLSCTSSKNISIRQITTETFVSNQLTPVVDGKAGEWPVNFFTYDKSAVCKYAIANDTAYLYLVVVCTDRMQQMKMIQGGTSIWIDTKLGKSRKTGIRFPLGGESPSMPGRGDLNLQADMLKQQAKINMNDVEIKGFKQKVNGIQPASGSLLIKPVMDWDAQNNLVYELAIPFEAFAEEDVIALKNISAGIIINGLKKTAGMQDTPPGRMQPRQGMRPPGGSPIAGRQQMQNITSDNAIWIKYTITK